MNAHAPSSLQAILKRRQQDGFIGRHEQLKLFQQNMTLPLKASSNCQAPQPLPEVWLRHSRSRAIWKSATLSARIASTRSAANGVSSVMPSNCGSIC